MQRAKSVPEEFQVSFVLLKVQAVLVLLAAEEFFSPHPTELVSSENGPVKNLDQTVFPFLHA